MPRIRRAISPDKLAGIKLVIGEIGGFYKNCLTRRTHKKREYVQRASL
jgi:hypothetical protein